MEVITIKENINLKKVREFLKNHQELQFSAADIEYSLYYQREVTEATIEFINRYDNETKDEKLLTEKVKTSDDSEELVNLMRKPLNLRSREMLKERLLQKEVIVLPLIQEKCLRNTLDIFIENAVRFFLFCEENCCKWIMENYSQMRSEYLKSLICLVLGIRGNVELIPFLMKEAERYEREYPFEMFERGPVLAVEDLYDRFINK